VQVSSEIEKEFDSEEIIDMKIDSDEVLPEAD
jgi:hypothetical protein